MARWWELAIPAGSTLAAAVSAGWITAAYQKKNGERLLRLQAEENEKARQAQLDHEKATQREELRKEREARTHEARKSAYIEFWRLSKKLTSQSNMVENLRSQVGLLPADAEYNQEQIALMERFKSELQAQLDLTDSQIESMTQIVFLGSRGMHQASRAWIESQRKGLHPEDLRLFEAAYVAAANYELSDPNPTMDVRQFHWESLELYAKTAGRQLPEWAEEYRGRFFPSVDQSDKY
ncbi:hypothetical protein ABTX15_17975 [Micromonospora sp. NPDC094482]|uniref:hypothetical protein n=1 Tax=unclassified Micromonospora TaxID=2617518 RepID=UPI0033170110